MILHPLPETPNSLKFIIETYGCQMNVADSELITSILNSAGFVTASEIAEADIIIFNTCSVREHAEQRVIGRIANEVSRKGAKPNLLVGVVGCMAQRLGEELAKINKKIDFVVGVDQYRLLPEIITNLTSLPPNADRQLSAINCQLSIDEVYSQLFPTRSNPLNAFVTIMRGCNNYCSYCIVPYTRGRERSRPMDTILAECRQAGDNKIQEITLLGQNVNSYRYLNFDFPDLLRKVNNIYTIKRIRFITSHPKDLSDKLIETMATSDKVCEHIHLPMQSGNDEILHQMNRGYTAEHYLNLIDKLRKAIPGIAITTDVIAGFPGETDAQFKDTFDLMREIGFDFAYMFKYSERSGTKACDLPNPVPEEVRLKRLQRLIDLQTVATTNKYKRKIGTTQEVYVESFSKKDASEMSGKTRDFKIVVFEGEENLIGQFVKVKITDAVGWTLKGQLIVHSS